ncbi:MAG TPA: DsrE family protein [Casimicrobiaceae bacterium]|jgi:intracellular sulfur oxidation DsrE/DsrF family protein|nr:DsrE family protein [Casimicrobiaceae bacterium]
MLDRLRFILAVTLVALAPQALAEKIVIQVSDGNPTTWNQALNVVGNLREAYGPGTDIEIVAFGQGINMLKLDAPVASRLVDAQKAQGAKVYACENSMARQKLARDDMAPGLVYVRAGVEHIITRQREGWVNLRP